MAGVRGGGHPFFLVEEIIGSIVGAGRGWGWNLLYHISTKEKRERGER